MTNAIPFLTYAIAFLFGLIFGSFFNVLIYRLPRGESIVTPGSRCPSCGRAIPPLENIPVLSYLFLRGKCAGCGSRISRQYPLVELLTGVLAVFLWHALALPYLKSPGTWADTVVLALSVASLLIMVPLAIIDLHHFLLPDSITLGGLALGIAASFLPGGITPLRMLLGVLAGAGPLLAAGYLGELILKKEAMGGGDIKLMAFIGAFWGWKPALMTIVFGSFLGAVIGITLAVLKVLRADRRIPFGPCLAVGFWVAVLAGDKIWTGYCTFVESLIL